MLLSGISTKKEYASWYMPCLQKYIPIAQQRTISSVLSLVQQRDHSLLTEILLSESIVHDSALATTLLPMQNFQSRIKPVMIWLLFAGNPFSLLIS